MHPWRSVRQIRSHQTPELSCQYLTCWTKRCEAAALLAKEAQAYQSQVAPWARNPAVYLAPSRAFYRYAALGTGLSLLVALVICGLLLS